MPVLPAGIGGSLTVGVEPSYGTVATSLSRAIEFDSESLEWKPARSVGKGIYGGMVARASARATTSATVDGDIKTPVYSKSMGLLLGAIFGSLGVAPVQQAATAAYLQTHALAGNFGQSLSVQVGRPDMAGVIHPYTYLGCKVTKAVIEAKKDQPVMLTLTIDGKDVSEAIAYTTPAYPTANPPLFWHQGAFQVGALGSEVPVSGVRGFVLTIERGQKTDNFYMDGTGRKQEPRQNAFAKITGDIETDYIDKTKFVDLFSSDTPQSIILPFTGGLIAGAYSYGLTLKLPHVRYNSEGPKIGGPDIIMPKIAFEAFYDDVNTACTATYMSTDTLQ